MHALIRTDGEITGNIGDGQGGIDETHKVSPTYTMITELYDGKKTRRDFNKRASMVGGECEKDFVLSSSSLSIRIFM